MRLSILIPVYNVERYIRRCFDSVYSQLLEDCEVVIVDDGSTDSSAYICDEYKTRFPSITKVIHKANSGVYSTRNVAMDNAEGDYLWLIDPDDFLTEGCVSLILKALEDYRCPEILSFAYKCCDDNNFYELKNSYCSEGAISGADYLRLGNPNPYLWCKVYRKDFVEKNNLRFLEGLYSQGDGLFNMQAYTYCKSMVCADIYAYNYYNNPNSTLHKKGIPTKRRNANNTFQVILAFQKFAELHQSFEAYEKLLDWQNYHIVGFLYALMIVHLPINEISIFIDKLQRARLYPIFKSHNKRADAFAIVANKKYLYLFFCWIHSRFFTER